MPTNDIFLEAEPQGRHRLRIDFFKLGDRFGHRLSVVLRDEYGGETPIPLAESVEGPPDDPWPPSPPLQSLSMEKLPDDQTAALLVGMAGRSHWSASIVTNDFDARMLKFDLACRCQAIPGSIGSEYQAMQGVALKIAKGCAMLCELNRNVCAMFSWHFLGQQPSAEALPGGRTSRFRMSPMTRLDKVSSTIRWQYTVTLPPPHAMDSIAERLGMSRR